MDTKAFWQLTYGLFLLSAKDETGDNACIINTAIQVASDPARISAAVIRKNRTCEMIARIGVFNLSCLTERTPFEVFRRFGMQSGRDTDKFAGFDRTARTANGLLRLTDHANAYFSAKVTETYDLGSHMLFVGEVTEAEVLSADASCTYGYYQRSIRPRPAAPVSAKKTWVCSVCGYVYEGDEVPDGFSCPLCHHGKEDFVLQEAKPLTDAPVQKWVCPVCGYVHEGAAAPEKCPQCGIPGSRFTLQQGELTWAAEHVTGVAKDAPQEIIDGLRANFRGECTEVGMYLAMGRAAAREGYPEIAKYWKTAAYEEAEHAAKFAELLGEVVSPSTRENLTVRVAAENGAAAGKTDLAKQAKALGLDAIHDTVHEMARDEARHGKAFAGLLRKHFGQ